MALLWKGQDRKEIRYFLHLSINIKVFLRDVSLLYSYQIHLTLFPNSNSMYLFCKNANSGISVEKHEQSRQTNYHWGKKIASFCSHENRQRSILLLRIILACLFFTSFSYLYSEGISTLFVNVN